MSLNIQSPVQQISSRQSSPTKSTKKHKSVEPSPKQRDIKQFLNKKHTKGSHEEKNKLYGRMLKEEAILLN